MNLTYSLLSPEDARQASSVEKECLQTAWSENQLLTLPEVAVYIVAKTNTHAVVGIGSMYCITGEAEVQNLAVLPEYRNHGIAGKILSMLFDIAVEKECTKIFLEVAASNQAAISLYEKNNFFLVGKRKHMYHGEDALIMEKSLC